MLEFVWKRVLQGILVITSVTVIVFVVTRVFSDPVSLMLPLSASDSQRADFARAIGLDQPIVVQLWTFAVDMLTLDFGDSLWQRRPAIEVVFERLPNTFLLIATGLLFAIAIAVPVGAIAALRPGGLIDRLAMSIGLVALAMPQFFIGLILIMLFAVQFKWFPTSGFGTAAHLVLPALTLAATPLARFMMMVRSSMIEELNQQYVRTARAKGLGRARILRVHALRNILVPFLNLSGWELIVALSGYTVVVETVFAWPGLGLTAVQAIQKGDLFLMQAVVFTIAFMTVTLTIAMDVCSKLIDPRIKLN